MNQVPTQQRQMKTVYSINENKEKGKSFFTKVGVGFVNRDGSITLKLEALPISGTLQVREWDPGRDSGRDQGREWGDRKPPARTDALPALPEPSPRESALREPARDPIDALF